VNDKIGRLYGRFRAVTIYEILSKIFLEGVRETAKILVRTGSI